MENSSIYLGLRTFINDNADGNDDSDDDGVDNDVNDDGDKYRDIS